MTPRRYPVVGCDGKAVPEKPRAKPCATSQPDCEPCLSIFSSGPRLIRRELLRRDASLLAAVGGPSTVPAVEAPPTDFSNSPVAAPALDPTTTPAAKCCNRHIE